MPHETIQPLSNIRILDLTQFIAGPYGTQILGDLGADIIKVDPPQGELSRGVPPHFVNGDSVYYLAMNRNKRAIAIDLKSADGQKLLRRLALACDVVFENYRPGVLDRLGLSVDDVRREKPSLIWCSVSGFGQTGPYRNKPAYDMVVQALGGGMSLTGEKGGPAVRAGIPIGDIAAGMYGVIGVLAALNRRTLTGEGETIDISMLDCQVAMLSYQAAYYLHSHAVPNRQGSGHDSIPTYRTFVAGDGHEIVVCANTERNWQGLCRALDLNHLMNDERFTTNRERFLNRHELWPLLEASFRRKPSGEWQALLEAEEIPVGRVNTLDSVFADPQVNQRDMIMKLEAEDGRTTLVAGDPIKRREREKKQAKYPPALGENSTQILAEVLRMGSAEIAALIAAGVIIATDRAAQQEISP
jgi:crotonobetainyl-CoA:carnitine CoA-transferase CaiB-like acyl-CoA transferase